MAMFSAANFKNPHYAALVVEVLNQELKNGHDKVYLTFTKVSGWQADTIEQLRQALFPYNGSPKLLRKVKKRHLCWKFKTNRRNEYSFGEDYMLTESGYKRDSVFWRYTFTQQWYLRQSDRVLLQQLSQVLEPEWRPTPLPAYKISP